jgi:L-threonylcarbamoyladenylate synthase
MAVRVSSVDPDVPPPERLASAVEALRSGGIVAVPTETFYGLAVDPLQPRAVRRLNEVKQRPPGSPVLLLLADLGQAATVARDLPRRFHALAEGFWPGPLTLVVPASERLPTEVTAGSGTVGLRVPGLALPRRLAAALGHPVTGVSANLHGQPPTRTAKEVARSFPEGVALVLDGGTTPGGAPSTVLDLAGPVPRLLRAGAVPAASLRPFLPEMSDDPGAPTL